MSKQPEISFKGNNLIIKVPEGKNVRVKYKTKEPNTDLLLNDYSLKSEIASENVRDVEVWIEL